MVAHKNILVVVQVLVNLVIVFATEHVKVQVTDRKAIEEKIHFIYLLHDDVLQNVEVV